LLVRAALDARFRERLLGDRIVAARDRRIGLTAVEERILLGATPAQLDALVRAAVPRADRRGFLKAASATVAALVAAGAAAGTGCGDGFGDTFGDAFGGPDREHFSCDGSRPDVIPVCQEGAAGNYWLVLSGTSTLVYLPRTYQQGAQYPWCVVLHDREETCLDAVSLLQRCADDCSVILVAPSWSGRAEDVESAAILVEEVLDGLTRSTYCLGVPWPAPVVAGVGAGATVALTAGLLRDGSVRSTIALCGPLPEGWDPATVESPWDRSVYLAASGTTPQLVGCAMAAQRLQQRGARATCVQLDTCAPCSPLAAAAAWQWIQGNG
jgi:hypothetical protein